MILDETAVKNLNLKTVEAEETDFEETIFTEDPDDPLDQRVREAWDQLKAEARRQSGNSLKAPLRELEELDVEDSEDAGAVSEEPPCAAPAHGSRRPAQGVSRGHR